VVVARHRDGERSAAPGRAARRLFNGAAAAMGLVVLAVPLLLTMAAIKATSPGPVFFRQLRVGRGGRLFRIYKFRTMFEPHAGAPGLSLGESGSVTPFGRLLRRSKIDELPQLINVLIGNMALVGPRPEIPEFVAKYSSEDQRIVLSVAPGLTDFASIRFRNEEQLLGRQANPRAYYERVLMPAKLRYYRFYVRRAGIGLDLYLIARTILALAGDLTARARPLPGAPLPAGRLGARFRPPRRRPIHRSTLRRNRTGAS
jgi:lipopolysaccharide/colanic/teichoic acid biosynthesis glycosyltransferase